ncbi:MAG: EamA family transporter RarD [Candidatus Competibacteraceae bacterium]|uniref:RarD protein, DMT superfamily transporter n=1 Tax=Candidatus Contendobacter odensis Run_B_J11 TaxID=1400861 RepID=A0A7U7J430_9GAMM|nr:EamA family transporter RarD [Candidatus Contendobacter odensis]MBK8535079.1 EamA family transporter RarD [Candidatus Competibacteraceae bacterium]CDH46821.1 RarD protein, DMT superfamily transporter [Candidatus Contendobacter odensis Run_B_J11]
MSLPLPPAPDPSVDHSLTGVLNALGCFGIWGLFPIYFKLLGQVPPLQVLAHRILWSVVVLLALILAQGQWHALCAEFRDWRRLRFYLLTTLLISTNWLLYIWAVQHGRILEASLGYYINPLVNVVLGVLFLHERLNPRQWAAVALAAVGVLVLIAGYGLVPWIALSLALSFGSYGMLRKKAGHPAALGLGVETALLAPVALLFLLVLAVRGTGAFGTGDVSTDLLLLAVGLITVAPLLMFLEATRLLRLSTVGLIQYLTPTLQFLLAVAVYREPFTAIHLAAFGCIWLALVLYSADAWSSHRRRSGWVTASSHGTPPP